MNRRAFLHGSLGALAASSSARASTYRDADCDVLVYGGTPCGIAAAIAAAREGARTILVEPTGHVGGLSTSGINTAETEHMLPWTIGGIADEFYRRLGARYGTGKPEYYFESSVAESTYLEMLREAGVLLRTGVSLDSLKRDGTVLAAARLSDGSQVNAGSFIDASYEGDLAADAGVSYTVGRESRSQYDEEAAGIRFDQAPRRARTVDDDGRLRPGISGWAKDLKEGDAHRAPMSYNFRLTVARDPRYRVPIPRSPRYDPARYALLADWLREQSRIGKPAELSQVLDLYPRRNGKIELNNKQAAIISLSHLGGQIDWAEAGAKRRAEIYQDHLDYTLGLLQFLADDEAVPAAMRAEMQSIGLHKDEFVDNGNLPYQLYVREARRIRGSHVVTQRDVQEDRRKADAIGMSSHFIDSHHVQRLALSPAEFVNEGRIWRMGYAYQIPYRAITPKPEECTNLLVPCAASYSHVAFCTLRLESVWMIVGHAAGVAAAIAARNATPTQKLDVERFQARLRSQGQVLDFIPGRPEKCEKLNGPPEF
ncbi:FAD-dependent oxidoreductase [Paludisphaera rhizosphaerae]|uniref:FAD-dependent oxidoreductase n=1 Tax=Paludisphaera rhizosphaerae TaxID=2711216 RepID=UPI0013E9D858|nr:FAD-dependent oxidoreductase [Paludisphaera rhizosphaerae]